MKNSIYTTAAGMMTSSEQLNIVANNLANVNSNGYKADISFEQTIRFLEEGPFPGKDQPVLSGTAVNMSQGMISNTGRNLDLAIEGPGFFTVEGSDKKPLYTRNGSLDLNPKKELITQDGFYVLDKFDRKVTIAGQKVTISPTGDVMVDDNYYTTLKIIDNPNRDDIEKVGNSYFKIKDGAQPPKVLETPSLNVGSLERSNVNMLDGIADLMRTQRVFEMQKTAADLMFKIVRKSITDVSKPI